MMATPVNLRGEKIGEPVKISNNKLAVSLKAYGQASVILESRISEFGILHSNL
jgi:hypothetical protein